MIGHLGVFLFFVISGYLITGILLRGRQRIVAGDGSRGQLLRSFYIRRTLRIWPAFYAVLAIAWLCDLTGLRDTIWWHATFTSNILFYIKNEWLPWPTAHLWSLSVEEQFYLLWPLLILSVPERAQRAV